MYWIFDICIDSDILLPGLGRCECASPDWKITCPPGPLDDSAFQWFHSWKSLDGSRDLMKVARQGDDYLLSVFDLVIFQILFDERRIEAYPLEDCPPSTMAHLLLDQVLPRVLCHQGRPVIHASSVLLNDGRAIAFSGPSGRGKSTLATAFHAAGHRVLADDCLLLDQDDGVVQAISAYSSLRLWPDSLEALAAEKGLQQGQISEMAHYTSKKQLFFESEGAFEQPMKVALSALFLLDDPLEVGQDEAVLITPATGTSAIMAIIEASFALDVVDRKAIQRNFEAVGQLSGHLPIFRLAYPRDYAKLSQVIDKVAEFQPDNT